MDGILEVMLRYVGVMIGGASKLGIADRAALDELRALTPLLQAARGGRLSDEQRLEVGLRSAGTRLGMGLVGRAPNASRLWYLATALTDLMPVSKIDANLMILPALLDAIADGAGPRGDASSVPAIAEAFGGATGVDASAVVLQTLGGPRVPAASICEPLELAEHALEVWGGQAALLDGIGTSDLADIYANSLAGLPL